MNKFELVRHILESIARAERIEQMSVLDIGCRNCELKDALPSNFGYTGLDICQNLAGTVDRVVNLEEGVPTSTNSYDVVVALDVLEHLNDFAGALEELLRVASRYVIVMLPNCAYLPLRLTFLLNGSFSKYTRKYDLAYGRAGVGTDRHRWLTVLSQSDAYMRRYATERAAAFRVVYFNGSRKRRAMARFAYWCGQSPTAFASASLYVLGKRSRHALDCLGRQPAHV